MWPGMRSTDDAGLNRQGPEWSGVAANARVHGTTYRMRGRCRTRSGPNSVSCRTRSPCAVPQGEPEVARDGLVSWEDSRYRVPLAMGGKDGAGGTAVGHGGDPVRR